MLALQCVQHKIVRLPETNNSTLKKCIKGHFAFFGPFCFSVFVRVRRRSGDLETTCKPFAAQNRGEWPLSLKHASNWHLTRTSADIQPFSTHVSKNNPAEAARELVFRFLFSVQVDSMDRNKKDR